MDHPSTKTTEVRPGTSEQSRLGGIKTRTEISTPTKAIGMVRARDDPRTIHPGLQLDSKGRTGHPKAVKVRTSLIWEIRVLPTTELVGM
jgi:hypothetical protein